jgi:hypothetical protein
MVDSEVDLDNLITLSPADIITPGFRRQEVLVSWLQLAPIFCRGAGVSGDLQSRFRLTVANRYFDLLQDLLRDKWPGRRCGKVSLCLLSLCLVSLVSLSCLSLALSLSRSLSLSQSVAGCVSLSPSHAHDACTPHQIQSPTSI